MFCFVFLNHFRAICRIFFLFTIIYLCFVCHMFFAEKKSSYLKIYHCPLSVTVCTQDARHLYNVLYIFILGPLTIFELQFWELIIPFISLKHNIICFLFLIHVGYDILFNSMIYESWILWLKQPQILYYMYVIILLLLTYFCLKFIYTDMVL